MNAKVMPSLATIGVLIHYYIRPEPYPEDDVWVDRAVAFLIEEGFLTSTERRGVYGTTERTKAYVDYLRTLGLPQQVWAPPVGGVE